MAFQHTSCHRHSVLSLCTVPSLVSSGETVTSNNINSSLGGKGLLQAIAIARAGQRVELMSSIGPDGASIPQYVAGYGVGSRACRIQSLRTTNVRMKTNHPRLVGHSYSLRVLIRTRVTQSLLDELSGNTVRRERRRISSSPV